MKLIKIIYPFLIVLLIGCGQEENNKTVNDVSLPPSFDDFYTQFHADSVFQLSHITFPLSGVPTNKDSLRTNDFYWQRASWIYQPGISLGDIYTKEFIVVGEDVVIENIKHKEVKFMMQRRFAKIGGDWNLIYFKQMGSYE